MSGENITSVLIFLIVFASCIIFSYYRLKRKEFESQVARDEARAHLLEVEMEHHRMMVR